MIQNSGNNGIDYKRVFQEILRRKHLFYKTLPIAFVLSCIYIFSLPRYYNTETTLAPETENPMSGGAIGSIASTFGLDLGEMQSSDAITPLLYPDLMEDNGFVTNMFNIQVTTKNGVTKATYHDYLKKHQKYPWWTKAIGSIKSLFTKKSEPSREVFDPYYLTKPEDDIAKAIAERVNFKTDKKTGVITITVKDQDPLVCAIMADSAKQHLQDFIIQYRTSKAHEDVAHYQHMRDSAEYEYNIAMERYSRFCDSHRGLVLQSYQSMQDKLQNELSLKQNSLSAMETQLQNSMLKLQEKTPAFTTLKSAVVPVRPTGPKRLMFVLMMLILASMATAGWLCKDEIFNLKEKTDTE